ncbi:3-oxoacyl-[acyl-carrier-protein] synthase II [Eubacterium uniforme]|uniref:3-oxoacyl-[acyl-carrier-protein] synthase 2 n=1 Tax=Eubacterium uniforme TaxID=39495 RepID=A0A1T4VLE3_9FIRM|nr:beta-ketoacyl-ACP synthase II [Eubacterium uniforme]SKA65756.1 3-oxoacyl-[acyl-carrier-protein] synthase II [Eubacterium uniforme]
MRKVVVTGLGALTPVGNNIKDMWESIKAGKCGIDYIKRYDATDYKVKVAGELKDFSPEGVLEKSELRKMDEYIIYAICAANEAINDSGIKIDEEDPYRCGIIFSSGIGGIGTIQKETKRALERGYERVSPYFIPLAIANMGAGNVAIKTGFKGICTSVVTACASGTNAVGDAFRQIRDGYQDVMLCGGSEAAVDELGIGGFTSMHALSTSDDPNRASIPFDKERTGFVMGEGAGVLVLEEYEHAKARGAHIYCEIAGYGATCDANHITAPLEDGSGAAKCMELAIKDANLSPEDITYINAHGTSTRLNDKGETLAIKKAFADCYDKVLVSSTKSMTGHMLGASGAVEAIITALSVANDVVPPTVNYKVPDEECDLDIVPNEARKVTVNAAISNSLGFGGHNATVLFKKLDA